MESYATMLDKSIQKSFAKFLHRVKSDYKVLYIENSSIENVLQEKMSTLFQDMVPICIYINDQVITRSDIFENHMDVLDVVLCLLKSYRTKGNEVK